MFASAKPCVTGNKLVLFQMHKMIWEPQTGVRILLLLLGTLLSEMPGLSDDEILYYGLCFSTAKSGYM